MKKFVVFFALLLTGFLTLGQSDWKMVSGKIATPWAANVNPASVLAEYPRPQLVRDKWINLNGLWNYTIISMTDKATPQQFSGKILVPFAVESALSGVGKTVGKDSVLWYQREFTVPANSKNNTVLLHFGAVDWQCEVFVNGKSAGTHQGGYDPFTFDITTLLNKSGKQLLNVRVWDPSDDGPQPRGKQVKKPNGIWYTPVTGIWQTVWMEVVPKTFISTTTQTPDVDKKQLTFSADVKNFQAGDKLVVTAWKGTEKIAEQQTEPAKEVALAIGDQQLWSPENPFLYDLKVQVIRKGKPVDEVKSYFAMRKISMGKDKNGIQRMLLNDKFTFQYGPLDQGWWPDGLYTAPTDEALKFDIEKTKEMGFNMIRKHVKVEPARWYYHCDKLGILVWQDMPSGDLGNRCEPRPAIYGRGTDKNRTPESENIYRTEWNEIMQDLHNFPSIVVWAPFNEAWGQFKTKEIVEWTMKKDPSRLVNSASGGNFEKTGHIIDLHNYPDPVMPEQSIFGADQIIVLGEFGGLGLPLEGHTWQDKNNWGYQSFKTREDLFKRYSELIDRFPHLIEKGLSAGVYTQTTDVEVETNGLMSYDRKEFKMTPQQLKAVHGKLYNPALVASGK